MKIEMVDLKGQYARIQEEVDAAVINTIRSNAYINGPDVVLFAEKLSNYLGEGVYVIPCANGTDSLQIAMMSLDLQPGDEVIVPSFTYAATAEVIGLLQLCPVMVDVDSRNFNVTEENIKKAITKKTKAIVPVHLFGQCADMESILYLAEKYSLYVIEDTAQALGAVYSFSNGKRFKAGTIGHIGCTSFFPSKNLGCYGDGGALFTRNKDLAEKIKMIANHGQSKKYIHKYIGVNSRLDTIQAAVLNVKLKYINEYIEARQIAADRYDNLLKNIASIQTPFRINNSTHVFHQYTIKITNGRRNELKSFLESNGVPAMIYYPIPLNEQEAYLPISSVMSDLSVTRDLCSSVLSLPMHTELDIRQQTYIAKCINYFFN